jgi:hypothetical protein
VELLRRIVLLAGVLACLWLALDAETPRLVTIDHLTERDRVPEKSLTVAGGEWERFLDEVSDGAEGRGNWSWRRSPERLDWTPPVPLFFRPGEPMIEAIVDEIPEKGSLALELRRGGRLDRFAVSRWTGDLDDFQFGSFSNVEPPDEFFRPLRKFALWPFLAALILYVVLPWPRRSPETVAYGRARVVAGDVLGTGLFALFFAMPLLILGGASPALLNAPGFVAVFWFLALFGVAILVVNAWGSSFAVVAEETGLRVRGLRGWRSHAFADMESFGPHVTKNPRWVNVLLVLAAVFGRGGAAGGAALGATYASHGIAIRLRSGDRLILRITDAMGGEALSGASRVIEALEAAGVRGEE